MCNEMPDLYHKIAMTIVQSYTYSSFVTYGIDTCASHSKYHSNKCGIALYNDDIYTTYTANNAQYSMYYASLSHTM